MYQVEKDLRVAEMNFDFTNVSTAYQTNKNKEKGQWYMDDINVTCIDREFGTREFIIEGRQFTNTSPPEVIDDFGEAEDDGQLILISSDFKKANSGFIKESHYKERLEKSDTGLPLVKLFWNL